MMMLRDVVVGVGKGISISVPIARTLEIQGFQDVIRIARIYCRAFPLAKFAIRSILVRRTRIEQAANFACGAGGAAVWRGHRNPFIVRHFWR